MFQNQLRPFSSELTAGLEKFFLRAFLSQLFSANSSSEILVPVQGSGFSYSNAHVFTGFPTVFSFAIESLTIVQGGYHSSICQVLRYNN
jgi:hypothetical protein